MYQQLRCVDSLAVAYTMMFAAALLTAPAAGTLLLLQMVSTGAVPAPELQGERQWLTQLRSTCDLSP